MSDKQASIFSQVSMALVDAIRARVDETIPFYFDVRSDKDGTSRSGAEISVFLYDVHEDTSLRHGTRGLDDRPSVQLAYLITYWPENAKAKLRASSEVDSSQLEVAGSIVKALVALQARPPVLGGYCRILPPSEALFSLGQFWQSIKDSRPRLVLSFSVTVPFSAINPMKPGTVINTIAHQIAPIDEMSVLWDTDDLVAAIARFQSAADFGALFDTFADIGMCLDVENRVHMAISRVLSESGTPSPVSSLINDIEQAFIDNRSADPVIAPTPLVSALDGVCATFVGLLSGSPAMLSQLARKVDAIHDSRDDAEKEASEMQTADFLGISIEDFREASAQKFAANGNWRLPRSAQFFVGVRFLAAFLKMTGK